jgi:UDP-galactopyranose mutase
MDIQIFFNRILDNKLINVQLNTDFFEFRKHNDLTGVKIIYTGPIDSYYSNCGFEKLEYRSINFHKQVVNNCHFYQPNSVVNYPSYDVPYTRIVEYKHFLNQQSKDSVIVCETTTDEGEPYYPVLNDRNLELYKKYKDMADKEKNVLFVGRLANYKYFNMDQAIHNALNIFKNIIEPTY